MLDSVVTRPGVDAVDDVRSAVDRYRDAVDRHDIDAAVAAYPGPLLPTSDAPGVIDLREELHARVRAAALSADVSVRAVSELDLAPGTRAHFVVKASEVAVYPTR